MCAKRGPTAWAIRALSSLPTIFDRLAAARVSHRYYVNNLPLPSILGFQVLLFHWHIQGVPEHAATGKLPAVSFADPNFTVLDDGTGNDDHPHADVRNGAAFLAPNFRGCRA